MLDTTDDAMSNSEYFRSDMLEIIYSGPNLIQPKCARTNQKSNIYFATIFRLHDIIKNMYYKIILFTIQIN